MQNYIHETVLRDIVDILHDAKDFDTFSAALRRNKSIKSVSSAAAGLVLVYPVIISNGINITTAQVITKAIERKAASLLRLLFASMQFNSADNVKEYLSQFHSNLKLDATLTPENILDTIDKYVVKESGIEEGTNIISNKGYLDKMMSKELKSNDGKLEHNSSLNETAIADYKFIENRNGNNVILNEGPKEVIDISKNRVDFLTKNLLDNEVKKSNELVETQMIIQIYHKTKSGTTVPVSFIIGVKAKMHPMDSMDIIERIQNKNKDNNFFLKFVQASTREISFFRDFIFAIDRSKIDALSISRRHKSSSVLWKVLERRAVKSKIKRLMGSKNNAMAISTLVITQEEVEFIKKEYDINVEDPSVITPIMESYNLMGFVIVDESTETAKFIFDTGEDLYEHLSFNSLERESSSNDYKKIVNLIAKGGI